ncbi:MAG: hypothetical protein DKT66_23400 [Candidatus Melainabacteria bacterium]|jgi:hypothetical protein|nr:MAG: hypothetical protein DKT66_23400 [Candidatus Melainabacteria bacterium]
MPKRGHSKAFSSGLTGVQTLMEEIITRPLVEGGLNQLHHSGDEMSTVAARFIKPNSKLTSFQRLEIYNQQYWYRLIDSLREDFPGLQAYLGEEVFELVVTGYLEEHKSSSYTLRNLGSGLANFLLSNQLPTKSKSKLGSQIAAFEWSDVIAFDEEFVEPVTQKDIEKPGFINTSLRLQPYISVLKLDYAVDSFIAKVKDLDITESLSDEKKRPSPAKRLTYCVVHRVDNVVHYKRVDSFAFELLQIFKGGCSINALGERLSSFANNYDDAQIAAQISNNFSLWTKLQWLYIDPEQGQEK